MSNLPVNVAVFFGKVDKRPSGWYWTPISEGQILNSGSLAGPFETKAAAVEDAHQAAITPDTGGNDEHKQRGNWLTIRSKRWRSEIGSSWVLSPALSSKLERSLLRSPRTGDSSISRIPAPLGTDDEAAGTPSRDRLNPLQIADSNLDAPTRFYFVFIIALALLFLGFGLIAPHS
jgi:hypothetical protein